MPTASSEVVSGRLTPEQLEAELLPVADTLRRMGVCRVTVEYWGGKATISVPDLVRALSVGLEDATFPQVRSTLGQSDFWIGVEAMGGGFEFCHENHGFCSRNGKIVR